MTDFWKYIKDLFKNAAQSSAQQPLIHELIERSEEELADYERWKKTLVCRRLFDWVHQQYAVYLTQPMEVDEAIDFLKTPSAKGFVVYFRKMQYTQRDIQHFFDLLKEKTKALNYRPYVSDTRTYTKGKWVENIQRHYLKPRHQLPSPDAPPIDQGYGNINIEMCSRNEEVWNLKFSATTYRDRMYREAGDFGELVGELFS